jgi:hypothetical protein
LSRTEEDGKNWLRRPKLCIESCRTIIIIIRNGKTNYEDLFKIIVFTFAYKGLGKPLKPLLA